MTNCVLILLYVEERDLVYSQIKPQIANIFFAKLSEISSRLTIFTIRHILLHVLWSSQNFCHHEF